MSAERRAPSTRARCARCASSRARPTSSLQNTPDEITVRAFDGVAADAWFRVEQHERDGMPLELLERDQVLAVVMPGKPGGPAATKSRPKKSPKKKKNPKANRPEMTRGGGTLRRGT